MRLALSAKREETSWRTGLICELEFNSPTQTDDDKTLFLSWQS